MSNFEQVQHYSKTLKIKKGLSRPAVSVVEIIRIDLQSWLQKADVARVQYSVFSEKDQKTHTERIERAYHFHFLIKISEQEGSSSNNLTSNQIPWEHIEVVANRDGVLNISPVYK
jgi:D-alanine-D-alanine ligase-like ATP-grasp enzyme